MDKRRDEGSLTEARGINQVQADKEIETGKRKDRKMSPSNGPVCGLAANLDCAIDAVLVNTSLQGGDPSSLPCQCCYSPSATRRPFAHIQAYM